MQRLAWALLALLLLAGCASPGADISQPTTQAVTPATFEQHYDLGVRYLSEGNYREAILAFAAAIEIDPMNPRGYLGAAEAYIGLGDPAGAEGILRQGAELLPDDTEITSKLEELLMTPHRFENTGDDGNLTVIYGQTDLEGRRQGFCIINVFMQDTNELIYVEEGSYVDGESVGELRKWWFPDTNVNENYGVENGCGRGVGAELNGERHGPTTVECYIGYSIPQVQEGEMIRWDDCSGEKLIYVYSGNMVNGEEHDDTGNAYWMYVGYSEHNTGQKVEYIGQIADGRRNGYGKKWRDGVLEHDGYFDNNNPIS